MFEQLFTNPAAIACHRAAPYAEERARYLTHCSQQGYSHATLLLKARELLWVARKLSVYPDLRVTPAQLEAAAAEWQDRQQAYGRPLNTQLIHTRFIAVARPWRRFLGCWCEPIEPVPFSKLMADFAAWRQDARGLSVTTIQRQSWYIGQFLRWYGTQQRSFADICLGDIDTFLAQCGRNGWARLTVRNMANALRAFFRYAGQHGWCQAAFADAIQGPRVFAQDSLPSGPPWPQVQSLLACLDTDRPGDIRDRAILMLFAMYGFRASEVAKLRLEAIDWERNLIRAPRTKQRRTQPYPLRPTMGQAIIRYLQKVRPTCEHREVFLTLYPPFRPLSGSGLHGLTSKHLQSLGEHTAHRGPHALRHSCAAYLLAEGFSLKEIGDHLGHHSAAATRIYAKVDLAGLREVAAFDGGELL